MWIEFDNQLVNLDLCQRIQVIENPGTDLEAPRRFVEITLGNDYVSEFLIREEYDTKELAQARYEELKGMLVPNKKQYIRLKGINDIILALSEIKRISKEDIFKDRYAINYNEDCQFELFKTKEERDNRYNELLILMGLGE